MSPANNTYEFGVVVSKDSPPFHNTNPSPYQPTTLITLLTIRIMDDIQSWSSFEERQRSGSSSIEVPSSDITSDVIIDALYLSSSSQNIAPAAVTLLKNTGLSTAPSSTNKEMEIDRDHNAEQEFRLKFHWMRPHPSLVLSVEDKFLTAMAESEVDDKSGKRIEIHARKAKQKHRKDNPAIESSRLMEVYRSSQMRKSGTLAATDSDCNHTAYAPDDDHNHESLTATKIHPPVDDFPKMFHNDARMEFPKLRINLASLVEPPLMTSWLPGGDGDNSVYCDKEGEDHHEKDTK